MKIFITLTGTLLLAVSALASGCATLERHATAETHRLDGDARYVDVANPRPAPGTCALLLPATLDRTLQQAFGYSGRLAELQPILDAVNARLAQRAGTCTPLAGQSPDPGSAPRVYVGTADSEFAPPEAADQRLPTDRFAPMVLLLERPAPAWRRQVAALTQAAGRSHAIAIQLGISQYAKGYSRPFRKSVQLGTGNSQPIRFLTSEDKPVDVLHLTGVLLDAGGTPVRAGAEGVILRDTPFLAQAFDVSRLFDESELHGVLHDARRADLPGAPLSLEVALDNVLAQLRRGAPAVPSD